MISNFLISKQSLARRALIQMAMRIAVVIIIATGISYWHVYNSLKASVIQNLTNYVDLRSKAESEQFLLAERQSAMLRDEFLRRLKDMGDYDPKAEFDRIFVREADGLIRVRPEINDHRHHATAYIRHDVVITPDLRRRFYTGWKLLDEWGPLMVNRFFSGFMNMPEQLSINFCPAADWGREANRDIDITVYETVWGATMEKNPERKPFWTSVYYDPGAKAWMLSRVTPGDYQGKWVVTGGQDVEIADLISRTAASRVEQGTWNFIVDRKSNLIAHPKLTDQIAKSGGNLQPGKLGDSTLEKMVAAVMSSEVKEPHTVEPKGLDLFLGVAKINGPEWLFVTVYPKKLLTAEAFSTARIFLFIGIASLLLELIIMAVILRRKVAEPVSEIVAATDKISHGDYNVRLDQQRNDELGVLASSVNRMAESIGERDAQLMTQYKELQNAKNREQDRQRLDSIGTLAGGIAHDFNNLLQGIFGYIAMAKLTFDQKEKALSMLEQAEKALHQSISLTTQLLTFSKGGKPVKEKINLLHLIENSARFALVGSRSEYHLQSDKDLWIVEADKGQIGQVIQNIVINADQSMPEGGVIKITARNLVAPDVRHPQLHEGSYLEISISDTGIGIPEKYIQKIFDPYFSLF